jgi:hypothetical protein
MLQPSLRKNGIKKFEKKNILVNQNENVGGEKEDEMWSEVVSKRSRASKASTTEIASAWANSKIVVGTGLRIADSSVGDANEHSLQARIS